MTRPFDEIYAYAQRLHQVDFEHKEPIPVSADEAIVIQDAIARMKGFARSSGYFDTEILGHPLLVL